MRNNSAAHRLTYLEDFLGEFDPEARYFTPPIGPIFRPENGKTRVLHSNCKLYSNTRKYCITV